MSGGYRSSIKKTTVPGVPPSIICDINACQLENTYTFPLKDDSKYKCYGYFIADIQPNMTSLNSDRLDGLDKSLKQYLTSEILPILNKNNKFNVNITLNEIKIYDFKLNYQNDRYVVEGHIYYEDINKLNTDLEKQFKKLPEAAENEINTFIQPTEPTPK